MTFQVGFDILQGFFGSQNWLTTIRLVNVRTPLNVQSVSPAFSGRPSMRFMFCTAAPDAPLPRLSI